MPRVGAFQQNVSRMTSLAKRNGPLKPGKEAQDKYVAPAQVLSLEKMHKDHPLTQEGGKTYSENEKAQAKSYSVKKIEEQRKYSARERYCQPVNFQVSRQVFSDFSAGQLTLDKNQLKAFIHASSGISLDEHDLNWIVLAVDKNCTGQVGLDEMQNVEGAVRSYLRKTQIIKSIFKVHDINDDGVLEWQELGNLLTDLNDGIPVPSEEVAWVMNNASTANKDGIVQSELERALNSWYKHTCDPPDNIFLPVPQERSSLKEKGKGPKGGVFGRAMTKLNLDDKIGGEKAESTPAKNSGDSARKGGALGNAMSGLPDDGKRHSQESLRDSGRERKEGNRERRENGAENRDNNLILAAPTPAPHHKVSFSSTSTADTVYGKAQSGTYNQNEKHHQEHPAPVQQSNHTSRKPRSDFLKSSLMSLSERAKAAIRGGGRHEKNQPQKHQRDEGKSPDRAPAEGSKATSKKHPSDFLKSSLMSLSQRAKAMTRGRRNKEHQSQEEILKKMNQRHSDGDMSVVPVPDDGKRSTSKKPRSDFLKSTFMTLSERARGRKRK